MKPVGFVYHEEYLVHDTGPDHPERPERLRAVVEHLDRSAVKRNLTPIRPTPAPLEWIGKAHSPSYIESIERRCLAGESVLDSGDTHVCTESYRVAVLAAGGVLNAVHNVLEGIQKSVFCAVRPPGHHAETATVLGFCLFNNVAIGARYAQQKHGIGRVAILDWDVHHGNGTQEIFWTDPSVLYISTHQYPLWPGTGASNESGEGAGEGFTLNCPMRPSSGEAEYFEAFRDRIMPALHKFRPELLMISAGFDAHKDDPLANINLTERSFARMTEFACEIATKYCNGRIVSVLEGGYNLKALANSVESHLNVLAASL
ncbi:MAG TPA: histone deacetylase [Bacteroidota bacterium]|nr:histone deacetylase [Bacteroidota bacterium]